MATQRIVADLHLHSRFSMATSRALDLESLAHAASRKGIDLLSTSDFTHPKWRAEIEERLNSDGSGFYRLRGTRHTSPAFILGTEVSCVWRDPGANGRGRRVHLLLFAPGFEAVDAVRRRLEPFGNLASDGRPLLRLSVRDLAELVMEADDRCEIIPAHAWTPWYGIYGSKSGFDSLEEAFGEHASLVHAVETGLSSDPEMNWAVPELDGRALVSFSDAHSAANVGRELTVFEMEPTYAGLRAAIASQAIAETVEFFPENGKYHLDGHRACGVRMTPVESREVGQTCPGCGKLLTLGVLNRVGVLSAEAVAARTDPDGLVRGPEGRPPFRRLVPLRDLVAASIGMGRTTKSVRLVVDRLIEQCGSELSVLATATRAELESVAPEPVSSAIIAVREGRLRIEPGYDGVYGNVSAIVG